MEALTFAVLCLSLGQIISASILYYAVRRLAARVNDLQHRLNTINLGVRNGASGRL